jgi:hypothetical protein
MRYWKLSKESQNKLLGVAVYNTTMTKGTYKFINQLWTQNGINNTREGVRILLVRTKNIVTTYLRVRTKKREHKTKIIKLQRNISIDNTERCRTTNQPHHIHELWELTNYMELSTTREATRC